MERSPADFPSHFPFLPLDSCYCPPKMNSNSNQVDHSRGESTDSSGTLIPSPRASAFSKSPIPPTIPTRRDYRTLVLCFDGTGDQFDSDNSNVVEFFSLLKKDDPSKQMVYYQSGIGTYTTPQIARPMFAKLSKTLDSAIALNLDAHIMGGYEFLMQNYTANDRICIFGFSRGAYTARCLAGMLHKVGLLPTCNHQQVPFAYNMYTRDDDPGWKQSYDFKKAFSIDVDIEFLGVWDTVNSVGFIPRSLPLTSSNTSVRIFRHALSLDERRARFKANLWHPSLSRTTNIRKLMEEDRVSSTKHYKRTFERLQHRYGKEQGTLTDVDEIWFAGCHCDVGGGSVENETIPCLARISLRWMIRECFKTNTGITFLSERMKEIGLDPASLHHMDQPRPAAIAIDSSLNPKVFIAEIPKKTKRTTTCILKDETSHTSEEKPRQTEEEAELHDALAPIYDQLQLKRFWWMLELIPMKHRIWVDDDKWKRSFRLNLGSGRDVPIRSSGEKVRVHRSVKTRMDAEYKDGSKYEPKVKLDLKNVIWVD